MKEVSAELISIGNELLAGYTVNTNATFISQNLKDIGIAVKWITTIADEADEIFNALELSDLFPGMPHMIGEREKQVLTFRRRFVI